MTLKAIFLAFSLIFITPTSFAQQEAGDKQPISSITDATWEQYKGEYSNSPLCGGEEITLWSCETPKKTYSLCSSTQVDQKKGYIQYRVSENGKTVFTFPSSKRQPAGLFTYRSFPNGDASIQFSNGNFNYRLIDPLRESSAISVTAKKTQNSVSDISCNNSNQTLQVNYTMRLMFDAGIWSGY